MLLQFLSTLDLTIRLLESRSSTPSSKLLWLASTWICDEQRTVELEQELLQLLLTPLINVFLVESYNCLGNCLANSCFENTNLKISGYSTAESLKEKEKKKRPKGKRKLTINLRCVTSALDSHAQVYLGISFLS